MEDAASEAPAVHDGWLLWEVPGKPVSVRLNQDLVGRLGMAVWEGFKALPRRGLETGGLLIGTKTEAGNQVVVTLDDFEPVESEHAAGPSYLLSDADRRMLEARIDAREAAAKNTSIVGFYRSHTRRDFAITTEDASLFSTYFREASDVFLLIKSNDGGPPTGGFIIREGGEVISDSPYAQFPLRTIAVPAAHLTPASALPAPQELPPEAQTVQPPAPERTTSFPVGQVSGRRRWPSEGTRDGRRVRWPSGLATAGAVALAVGLVFAIQRPEIQRRIPGSMPPAKPGLPLALNVTNTGTGLRLSWDHNALPHARHAVLWIKDGHEERSFELDSKQLSEGTVAYWPRNSDVNFRLEFPSPGANVSESVRAIGGPSKALVAVPAPAAGTVESPIVPAGNAPAQAAVDASPASVPAPKPPRRNQSRKAAVRQRSRAFVLTQPEHLPAVASAALPDPPTFRPLPLEHSNAFQPLVPAKSLGPRESVDSSFRVSVRPVSGSRLEQLARNIPLIGKRYRRSDYVPPAPLRNPALPPLPHRNVAHHVNIDVKVYVTPSGKVDYSEVVSKVPEADRELAALAVFYARQWEFVPARDGDGAVPGEVILRYEFGPAPRAGGNLAGIPAETVR